MLLDKWGQDVDIINTYVLSIETETWNGEVIHPSLLNSDKALPLSWGVAIVVRRSE